MEQTWPKDRKLTFVPESSLVMSLKKSIFVPLRDIENPLNVALISFSQSNGKIIKSKDMICSFLPVLMNHILNKIPDLLNVDGESVVFDSNSFVYATANDEEIKRSKIEISDKCDNLFCFIGFNIKININQLGSSCLILNLQSKFGTTNISNIQCALAVNPRLQLLLP